MRLDRDWIRARIPHQGSMCLLDEVLEWSAGEIRCRASSHRDPGNPLRAHGRLGSACGIEYAAQAMAVHGALVFDAATGGRRGLLASARSVRLAVDRLDDCAGDLVAAARRVHGDAAMVLYEFNVSHEGRVLVAGRATIAFAAPPGGRTALEDPR